MHVAQLPFRFTRDIVFSDGWTTQMGTVTGDLTSGFVSTLVVTV